MRERYGDTPDPSTTLGGTIEPRGPRYATSGKGSLQNVQEPALAQHNLVDRALRSFGQPSLDAVQSAQRGAATPQEVARTFLETGPVGPFGMMAGRLARTADQGALRQAEEMARAGRSRDDIWRDTGWFQGSDGKWRFEIDDSGTRWAAPDFSDMAPGRSIQTTADSALPHHNLRLAYPDVSDLFMQYVHVKEPKIRAPIGLYASSPREGMVVRATDRADPRSVTLHELQHAIQRREEFARGGTMESAANAPDLYRRTAGEVEARNVQARMDMTPEERRARPPWETQDVTEAEQILRQHRPPEQAYWRRR